MAVVERAALTLLSGAVMMVAGYIGGTGSWTAAGLITIPGGLLILAAFALARHADQTDSRRRAPGSGHRASRIASAAATLISGGAMVLAGYSASKWGWGLAALVAIAGGLVISVAFCIAKRDTEATAR